MQATLTSFAFRVIEMNDDETGLQNCVEALQQILP